MIKSIISYCFQIIFMVYNFIISPSVNVKLLCLSLHRVYESFYLKYGICKQREVKNPINECASMSLYIFSPPEVYKSHILNRMIQ